MRKLMFVLVASLLVSPTLADAQSRSKSKSTSKRPATRVVHVSRSDRDCCWGNRFSFEPYAGAMKDAYDTSPDGENTGYLVGFRVGYLLSSRTRLLGNVGYSKSDDVANPEFTPTAYHVYDNTWVFTTAGGEFDVVPGRTSVALGLQGGAAWRRTDFDGTVGSPVLSPDPDAGFSAQEVLIPGLTFRHRLTNRATVMAGVQDNIFNFLEGPARHSLAVTAGVAFR
jgi:hypothetical protein